MFIPHLSSVSLKVEIPDFANVSLSCRGKRKDNTSPIHKKMRKYLLPQTKFVVMFLLHIFIAE